MFILLNLYTPFSALTFVFPEMDTKSSENIIHSDSESRV